MERILILTLSNLELGVCLGTQMQVPGSHHPDHCEDRKFCQTGFRLLIWSEDWQLTQYNWGSLFISFLICLSTSGVVYHCLIFTCNFISIFRVPKHSPPRPAVQSPSFLPLPMGALRNVQSTLQRSDLMDPKERSLVYA